ncbi:hypothetical protein IAR55_002719 [Kwoniella newhampshirensis]|uniref:Uncharacterized protein n=1 Tax=Kwoniella newhampshirensis TaxID=1651941 RepID=A0AAW0Z019_9TREE
MALISTYASGLPSMGSHYTGYVPDRSTDTGTSNVDDQLLEMTDRLASDVNSLHNDSLNQAVFSDVFDGTDNEQRKFAILQDIGKDDPTSAMKAATAIGDLRKIAPLLRDRDQATGGAISSRYQPRSDRLEPVGSALELPSSENRSSRPSSHLMMPSHKMKKPLNRAPAGRASNSLVPFSEASSFFSDNDSCTDGTFGTLTNRPRQMVVPARFSHRTGQSTSHLSDLQGPARWDRLLDEYLTRVPPREFRDTDRSQEQSTSGGRFVSPIARNLFKSMMHSGPMSNSLWASGDDLWSALQHGNGKAIHGTATNPDGSTVDIKAAAGVDEHGTSFTFVSKTFKSDGGASAFNQSFSTFNGDHARTREGPSMFGSAMSNLAPRKDLPW